MSIIIPDISPFYKACLILEVQSSLCLQYLLILFYKLHLEEKLGTSFFT